MELKYRIETRTRILNIGMLVNLLKLQVCAVCGKHLDEFRTEAVPDHDSIKVRCKCSCGFTFAGEVTNVFLAKYIKPGAVGYWRLP